MKQGIFLRAGEPRVHGEAPQEKVDRVANYVPELKMITKRKRKNTGTRWGSTYGSIKTAVKECIDMGIGRSHRACKVT